MKILDRYILSTYLKTFISVFVILMLIFVLQTIWLYIKELAGKDLDIVVVAKFLFYFSPKLIPLVLPLTILLASIMVFGSFAENYEFAAMKSTGISLQRAMTGLSIFILALAITTFFFANNVIPWGELNSYNLRKNIQQLKPAMVIAKGQFNQIGDEYNLKVKDKTGDRGQYLEEVIIHKKTGKNNLGNHTTIISKTGELIGNEDSNILKFILQDGYFYDDTPSSDPKDRQKHPMTRSYFEKYTINIDLSELNDQDLEEKNITNKYNMLNISDLNYSIDSLRKSLNKDYDDFANSLYNRSNLPVLNTGVNIKKDSTFDGSILDFFTHSKKVQLIDMSINSIKSSKQIIDIKDKYFKERNVWLNKHIIALHEKLALGFACIILFFVGAPLGALIRKGGIGLPMVIAILLFLTYHFIGIFAKNSANDGSLNPVIASWFSTLIMLPLGYYLTKRATADRGLFEFDHILEPLKKLFRVKSNKHQEIADKNEQQKITLTPEQSKIQNIELPNYKAHTRFALLFYSLALVFFILYFILKNNKLNAFAISSIQLSLITFICFVVYFIKTYINIQSLSKLYDNLKLSNGPIYLILSFVLFPFVHFMRKDKITQVIGDSLK
ncbi:YjgP/YjgQ family permease [Hanstruepera neustonica]|uniref:YjgP/YjgQ family permease n=1 Tax=Hanstruepera neustonica TaxID=1445657 RepID=A0A2K1DXM7_9FLAO|nr:LptF/LptG family permease [Hanstruepera neustonica]PNQ72781.1 YjgP/YjgQ family permease [Hanstruepera neustonica]